MPDYQCPMAGPDGCECDGACTTCPRADAECPVLPEDFKDDEERERLVYSIYV